MSRQAGLADPFLDTGRASSQQQQQCSAGAWDRPDVHRAFGCCIEHGSCLPEAKPLGPGCLQMVTAVPEVRKEVLQPGDEFILLACDGIWDVLTNQEVRE